jgi:hypothetical protein
MAYGMSLWHITFTLDNNLLRVDHETTYWNRKAAKPLVNPLMTI